MLGHACRAAESQRESRTPPGVPSGDDRPPREFKTEGGLLHLGWTSRRRRPLGAPPGNRICEFLDRRRCVPHHTPQRLPPCSARKGSILVRGQPTKSSRSNRIQNHEREAPPVGERAARARRRPTRARAYEEEGDANIGKALAVRLSPLCAHLVKWKAVSSLRRRRE